MRIAIKCTSPLLQKTFVSYLDEYIYEYELADIVIVDSKNRKSEKIVFYVGFDSQANLQLPFTKDELFDKLDELYKKNPRLKKIQNTQEALEVVIRKLNKKHREKIAKLMKSYYAKR